MAEYSEEDKQRILEKLAQKPWQTRDLAKILKMKKRDVDKIVKELINEGKAGYWSTGSTTYVTTPEKIEELESKRK
jgi:predicted transcriptional regulator